MECTCPNHWVSAAEAARRHIYSSLEVAKHKEPKQSLRAWSRIKLARIGENGPLSHVNPFTSPHVRSSTRFLGLGSAHGIVGSAL